MFEIHCHVLGRLHEKRDRANSADGRPWQPRIYVLEALDSIAAWTRDRKVAHLGKIAARSSRPPPPPGYRGQQGHS